MSGRGRYRAVSIAAIAVLALSFGGVAEAKKKKPGPVQTVSASASGSGNAKIVSATATCPGKKRAVGGGFLGSPPSTDVNPVFTPFVFESQKIADNAWRASTQIQDTAPPHTITITSYVDCRKRAPRTATASSTVRFSNGKFQGHLGPAAVATCPGKKKALAGGFATSPPITSGGGPTSIVIDSLRDGGSSWVTQVASDAGSGSVTSQAYCAKKRTVPRAVSGLSSANSTFRSSSTAIASCTGRRRPLAGGFSQPGALFGGPAGDSYFLVYESRPVSKTWQVTGQFEGGTANPRSLGSTAYCG